MVVYPANGVKEPEKQSGNFLFPKGKYRMMLDLFYEGTDKKANKCIMKWVCHDEPYSGKSFWQEIPIIDKNTGKVTPWFKHTMHELGCIDDDNGDLIVQYEALQGGHYILDTYISKGKAKDDGSGDNWPDKTAVNSIKPFEYSAQDVANAFDGKIANEAPF